MQELRSRTALDAGCGKGRFSYFTAPYVQHLVALDGSIAVQAAAKNLSSTSNTSVVRGDMRSLPFGPGSFGFVSCLGVLHHLTDPRAGFDELVRVLADDAFLLIYVYSRPERRGVRSLGLSGANFLRRVTVKMPHRLLRLLSAPLSAVLYLGFVLPGRVGERLGMRRLSGLPLQTYRGRPVRSLWLDTFDRLSAPLEARYTWGEIQPWFTQNDLEVLSVREDAGFFVVARRLPRS